MIQLGKLPELIAISETKLRAKFKMQLQGYNFIQNNSNTNAGGVGMFVTETLTFQSATEYQLHTEGCEDLWITANINNTKKVYGVLYRHPQKDFINFSKSLEQTLTTLNKNKTQYFICGDVNINLLDYESKGNIKDYVDMLCGSGCLSLYPFDQVAFLCFPLGCLPLIKHPTRITSISSTLIDHIYTNSITQHITSNIFVSDVSDYLPVLVLIHNLKNKTSNYYDTRLQDTFESAEFVIDLSEELNKIAFSLDPLSSGDDFTIFLQHPQQTCSNEEKNRK